MLPPALRVGIWGMGGIGTLFAESFRRGLSRLGPSSRYREVKLECITNSHARVDLINQLGKVPLKIDKNGLSQDENIETKLIAKSPEKIDEPYEIIFLTVPAYATLACFNKMGTNGAFLPNNSDTKTTLVLLQNGMGMKEEIQERHHSSHIVNVVSALTYNGVRRLPGSSNETFVATGRGETFVQKAPHLPYLQEILNASDLLGPVHILSQQSEIANLQWNKLITNAVINPTTGITGRCNGFLVNNDVAKDERLKWLTVALMIIREGVQVRKTVDSVGDQSVDFSDKDEIDCLLALADVLKTARATGPNHSSMLQALEQNRPTEIDYINNYIVQKGTSFKGCSTICNRMMVNGIREREIVFNKK
eukprot:g4090.t1